MVFYTVFNILSVASRRPIHTHPCLPTISICQRSAVFCPILHYIVSKQLAVFQQNHRRNLGQRLGSRPQSNDLPLSYCIAKAFVCIEVVTIGHCMVLLNQLPDDKILDWSKLKQIAYDISKCI